MTSVWIWLIAGGTIAGILLRPRQWPESIWACLGGMLLATSGLLSFSKAARAVGKGLDVYLFLTGMMLLAGLARRVGVDWLAALAVNASRGSGKRLFTLIYGIGILVTVFLSNDATAVRKASAGPAPVASFFHSSLDSLHRCNLRRAPIPVSPRDSR